MFGYFECTNSQPCPIIMETINPMIRVEKELRSRHVKQRLCHLFQGPEMACSNATFRPRSIDIGMSAKHTIQWQS